MSIEDVQRWPASLLDIELCLLMGAEEDKHRPGRVMYGDKSMFPKTYSTDISNAREAQAKAIELDAIMYLKQLSASVSNQSYEQVQEYDLIQLIEVVRLLQATPRQIAEAAYLTLKG
ncbi:hypothetical protein D3C75_282070 [compost metagenome]